jgi:hypothetical protein
MPILITAPASASGRLNPFQGTFEGEAVLVATGLSNNSDNDVSLTSDGTVNGTPRLPVNKPLIGIPVLVPSDSGANAWYEKAVPSVDAAGNIVLHIHSNSGGPTSFRIHVKYGT